MKDEWDFQASGGIPHEQPEPRHGAQKEGAPGRQGHPGTRREVEQWGWGEGVSRKEEMCVTWAVVLWKDPWQ